MLDNIDQPTLLAIGSLLGLACLVAWFVWRSRRSVVNRPKPRPAPKPFLTNRKHAMLAALERVLPMYRIHAQVSVGALLASGGPTDHRPQPTAGQVLAQRIVDFVIVDPDSSMVIALVEMDERFADPDEEGERDAMMALAGYATIRIASSDRATVATAQAAVGHLRDAALKVASTVTRLPMPARAWPLESRFGGPR